MIIITGSENINDWLINFSALPKLFTVKHNDRYIQTFQFFKEEIKINIPLLTHTICDI